MPNIRIANDLFRERRWVLLTSHVIETRHAIRCVCRPCGLAYTFDGGKNLHPKDVLNPLLSADDAPSPPTGGSSSEYTNSKVVHKTYVCERIMMRNICFLLFINKCPRKHPLARAPCRALALHHTRSCIRFAQHMLGTATPFQTRSVFHVPEMMHQTLKQIHRKHKIHLDYNL